MRRLLSLLAAATLIAACADSADEATVPVDDPSAVTEPVDDGVERFSGSLEAGDDTLTSGEYYEQFEVLAREGQWIRAEVLSSDFDPYIIVLSPTDVQTDVDDSAAGNTTMTRAILAATEAGEWKVVVTSFAPGETGTFEMTVEVTDTRPADAETGTQASPDDLPADPAADA